MTTKQLYLYDPRYNIKTPCTYKELEARGIINASTAASSKSRNVKIKSINKYVIDDSYTTKDLKELYCREEYDNEIWRDVSSEQYNLKNKYLISNYGRMKRVGKTGTFFVLPFKRKSTGRDYLFVKLQKNNQTSIEIKVSRLVAEAFLEKPLNVKDVLCITYINGIKYDNRACNLEYITKTELGKFTGGDSKSMATYKLDSNTFEIVDTYSSVRKAAKDNNMSYQKVLDMCNAKYYSGDTDLSFMKEDEYEEFMDNINEEKYLLFNAKTCKKYIGTILELKDIYHLNMRDFRYCYISKKCISNNCIYVLDVSTNDEYLNDLYLNCVIWSENWRPVEINKLMQYEISDYGRIRDEDKNIMPFEIENGTKVVTLYNKTQKTFKYEVSKLVCLFFKRTTKNKTYDDIKDYITIYADNDIYNTKSTNIEIIKEDIDFSLLYDEMLKEEICSVAKTKKVVKNEYENLASLSQAINVSEGFIYHCINNSFRINNKYYMFKRQCENFKYEY